MESWLPAAVIAAFVTAGSGLYWNFRSAKAARKLPFLQRQLDLCFEAVEVVAVLSTTSDPAIWAEKRERFWQLYYGPLAIVEGRKVEECMVACSRRVPPTGAPPELPTSELCGAALELSQAVRSLLIDAWGIQSLEETLAGKSGIFDDARRAYREEYTKQMGYDQSSPKQSGLDQTAPGLA